MRPRTNASSVTSHYHLYPTLPLRSEAESKQHAARARMALLEDDRAALQLGLAAEKEALALALKEARKVQAQLTELQVAGPVELSGKESVFFLKSSF